MIKEHQLIVINEEYTTVFFKDGEVNTINTSKYAKSRQNLIDTFLIGLDKDSYINESITIKDGFTKGSFVYKKKIVDIYLDYNEHKAKINLFLKNVFNKMLK